MYLVLADVLHLVVAVQHLEVFDALLEHRHRRDEGGHLACARRLVTLIIEGHVKRHPLCSSTTNTGAALGACFGSNTSRAFPTNTLRASCSPSVSLFSATY